MAHVAEVNALVTPDDEQDGWWADLLAVPLLCQRCGADLKDGGSVDVPLGCGWCQATACGSCGLVWAADGPAGVGHDNHGERGHGTLGEQIKTPAAVKPS